MPIQFSVAVRNAELNAIEVTISTTPVLRIFTGAPPPNCAAANTGTELAALDLPSDWLAAASSGAKALAGTWEDVGIAAGDVGHFRVYAADGTTCHIQGTATAEGGGGDMEVGGDGHIEIDDDVAVTTFTLTAGNA